jgi:hypothetical protein
MCFEGHGFKPCRMGVLKNLGFKPLRSPLNYLVASRPLRTMPALSN